MTIEEWIKAGRPLNKILLGDCMDLMELFEDNYIQLSICDPPYGIGYDLNAHRKSNQKYGNSKTFNNYYKNTNWDEKIPDESYFMLLQLKSKNQIIWGGNYFIDYLKNTSCMIVWYKDNGNTDFADCELAWSSFKTAVRIFKYRWNGMLQENMKNKEKRIHPTQKPVALYRWLLQNYAKKEDLIFDSHSGSGSLAIACHLEGFNFIAIEKDIDYWEASVKRYEEEISQGKMF